MDNAWLDSLSEDWVSQPRSDDAPSGSASGSGPSQPDSRPNSVQEAPQPSRIPVLSARVSSRPDISSKESLPLSERNSNIPAPKTSKADYNDNKGTVEVRGRGVSRAYSVSTSQSVQQNTVHHKSLSLSPEKLRKPEDTPEWKRRLIHGEVGYGEQKDLFSAVGLESIFMPPPSTRPSTAVSPERNLMSESVMPSSPPAYFGRSAMNESTQDRPRGISYKATENASDNFSDDISQSSVFRPRNTMSTMSRKTSDQPSLDKVDETREFESSIMASGKPQGLPQRFVSGQSEIRHELLSPVFLSRTNTADGKPNYAAIAMGMSTAELQQRLEALNNEEGTFREHANSPTPPLPEDSASDTDSFAHNGNFVNMGRGGVEEDGSFQKRALSPSSIPSLKINTNDVDQYPDDSVQANTPAQLPRIRRLRPSNEYSEAGDDFAISSMESSIVRDDRPMSKSSPLKLFGDYDTYTNQKLLRRLSQFEGGMPVMEESSQLPEQIEEEKEETGQETRTEMNAAYIAPSSPVKGGNNASSGRRESLPFTQFGAGKLDQYEFEEEVNLPSWLSSEPDDEERDESFLGPEKAESRPKLFDYSYGQSGSAFQSGSSSRQSSFTTKSKFMGQFSRRGSISSAKPRAQNKDALNVDMEQPGKRYPKSPLKDPTPKRRRTLHKSDIDSYLGVESEDDDRSYVTDSMRESQRKYESAISGGKRKDSFDESSYQSADPEVLAQRSILRPTSSHLRLSRPTTRDENIQKQKKIARVQAELDQQSDEDIPADESHLRAMANDSRKGSVTTQDFFMEAKSIMAAIREKARPRSDFSSMEQSQTDAGSGSPLRVSTTPEDDNEDSYDESSLEPFERPPSRDNGKEVPRQPREQKDPEVVEHLRQYEEQSDFEAMVGSSIRSNQPPPVPPHRSPMHAKKVDIQAMKSPTRATWILNDNVEYESDPPNIRITVNPEKQRTRGDSSSSAPELGASPTHRSQASSNHTYSQSVPTGSSRNSGNSDSRRIIMPDAVSHLIPEQLAGMVFDRTNNCWVKRRTRKKSIHSLPSEADPFEDIPDLTVDETVELARLQSVAARHREEHRLSVVQEYQGDFRLSQFDPSSRPQSKDGIAIVEKRDSSTSQPSHFAQSTTSEPLPETRATSYEHDEVHGPPLPRQDETADVPEEEPPVQTAAVQKIIVDEEVIEDGFDDEISIQGSRPPMQAQQKRQRRVTISFSSPVASIIRGPSAEYEDISNSNIFEQYLHDDDNNSNSTESNTNATPLRSGQRLRSRGSSMSALRRPVSRIEERDEDSPAVSPSKSPKEEKPKAIMDTPAPKQRQRVVSQFLMPSSAIKGTSPDPHRDANGLYQLSPMSDFTMHRPEESFAFEVSYVAPPQTRRRSNSSGKRTMSTTVKELVQRITDVEPHELYWEHIKRLELHQKRLQSLHMLSKFCGKLEELDASENQIAMLDGMPDTIRTLRISHNVLSDMTSWHQLRNLQYLDISNNELTNLDGLKSLIHLRSVRADNNKIESISGVFDLDGLISLRLRNNAIKTVDFTGSKLQRLSDLDLKGNEIHTINGLHDLQGLSNLHLEDNKLTSFSSQDILYSLKHLKLSGNQLTTLNVSYYPNLRLLYLDNNKLGTITGLLRTKHLDSLSVREQHDSILDMAFLDHCFEIRKLFISGNRLQSFAPRMEFLNLQYLEMANCGLEALPRNFGELMANLRVLNLNFNALSDLKPLLAIVRLKRLHVAGNRLIRLRRTCAVLRQFPSLTNVDLRNNPLTLGFYSTMAFDKSIVLRTKIPAGEEKDAEPFCLPDADEEADGKYAARLDDLTKMRRRAYEMLVLGGCERLRRLDGLGARREVLVQRDEVWGLMAKAGLVKEIPRPIEEEEGAEKENEKERVIPEIRIRQASGETEPEVVAVTAALAEVELNDAEKPKATEASIGTLRVKERDATWPAEDSFA